MCVCVWRGWGGGGAGGEIQKNIISNGKYEAKGQFNFLVMGDGHD